MFSLHSNWPSVQRCVSVKISYVRFFTVLQFHTTLFIHTNKNNTMNPFKEWLSKRVLPVQCISPLFRAAGLFECGHSFSFRETFSFRHLLIIIVDFFQLSESKRFWCIFWFCYHLWGAVNLQMVVGGCCLTLFIPTLCTSAMTNSLAEQHFNWSHFCQTRQAKTHLGI